MSYWPTVLVMADGRLVGDTGLRPSRHITKLDKSGAWMDFQVKLASWCGVSFAFIDVTGCLEHFHHSIGNWTTAAPALVLEVEREMRAALEVPDQGLPASVQADLAQLAEGILHHVYTPEHYAATEGRETLRPEPRRGLMELD